MLTFINLGEILRCLHYYLTSVVRVLYSVLDRSFLFHDSQVILGFFGSLYRSAVVSYPCNTTFSTTSYIFQIYQLLFFTLLFASSSRYFCHLLHSCDCIFPIRINTILSQSASSSNSFQSLTFCWHLFLDFYFHQDVTRVWSASAPV